MLKIIWSDTARAKYFDVLDYLYDEWGEQSALKFEERIAKLENQIASGIVKFPISDKLGHEKCVVNKQNSLIFKRFKDRILIKALIDNRSNHPY